MPPENPSRLFLTGANGALGSAIARYFIERGWRVAGFSRHAPEDIASESFRFFAADLANEESVETAFGRATDEFGSPDALIATVGGVRSWNSVADTPMDDFQALLELNLVTFFLSARAAIRRMQASGRGGAIISIGAEAGLTGGAKRSGYAASKAGVVALTQVIAVEGKDWSLTRVDGATITANCIVPTIIDTPANREWGDPEDFVRWTKPEEIAAMAFHLALPEGRSVTGSVMRMPNRM